MSHPAIESLLILQDRDTKRLNIEAQLKAVPGDIARVEQKIAAEKAAIETAKTELKELEVKYAIDEAKKKFAAAEAVLKTNISGHESRIKTLREREASLTTELKAAQAEVATARAPVGESRLRIYDRIASRNMPAVVP